MSDFPRTESRLGCVYDAEFITHVGQRAVWAGRTKMYQGMHGVITEVKDTAHFRFIVFKPDGLDVNLHGFHDTAFPETDELNVQAIREHIARVVVES